MKKSVKEFIRVPIINDINKMIKEEVIGQTKLLLDLDKSLLSNIVHFKEILQQKFDKIQIKGNQLEICYKNNCVKCKIKGDVELVQQTITENLPSLVNENGIGSISELKMLPVIDFERQSQIKDYIDDLVFSLYFKVKLPEIGFTNRENIKAACKKNKYYKIINR